MNDIRFGTVTLAAAGDHIFNYRERSEGVTDLQRPMRGDAGRVVDRGGRVTMVTFTVSRQHSTHVEARAHIRERRREVQDQAIKGTTDVAFSISGGGSLQADLENAAVTVADSWTQGVTSFINYSIQWAEKD